MSLINKIHGLIYIHWRWEKTLIEKREKWKTFKNMVFTLHIQEKNPHKPHKRLFHGFHQSKHSYPKQITTTIESNPSLSFVFPWLRLRKNNNNKWYLSQNTLFLGFIGSFLIIIMLLKVVYCSQCIDFSNSWNVESLSPMPESNNCFNFMFF